MWKMCGLFGDIPGHCLQILQRRILKMKGWLKGSGTDKGSGLDGVVAGAQL